MWAVGVSKTSLNQEVQQHDWILRLRLPAVLLPRVSVKPQPHPHACPGCQVSVKPEAWPRGSASPSGFAYTPSPSTTEHTMCFIYFGDIFPRFLSPVDYTLHEHRGVACLGPGCIPHVCTEQATSICAMTIPHTWVSHILPSQFWSTVSHLSYLIFVVQSATLKKMERNEM